MIFAFVIITILASIVSIAIYHLLLFAKRKLINKGLELRVTELKIRNALIALTLVFSSYQTFTQFYPPESFYKDEFEHYTGIKFPKSGKILNPYPTHPIINDDFAILAKFEKQDYDNILSLIKLNSKFEVDTHNYAYRKGLNKLKYKEQDFFTLSYTDSILIFEVTFQKNGQLIAFEKYYWD
ncbi:MAG: hypothetical protein ACK50L_00305 [Bacteroidota bacterium]